MAHSSRRTPILSTMYVILKFFPSHAFPGTSILFEQALVLPVVPWMLHPFDVKHELFVRGIQLIDNVLVLHSPFVELDK